MEKYWLLNQINLNRDVLGYINRYLQVKWIEPPSNEDLKKMIHHQINMNGIYFHTMKDYVNDLIWFRTMVHVENSIITSIIFDYNGTNGWYSVYVNLFNINTRHLRVEGGNQYAAKIEHGKMTTGNYIGHCKIIYDPYKIN